ncbi:MAG: GNAT family N-acetyltransferase [Defluviitaleaceae bacterium]|nr:GNAT family N-acetyltransferase [Defluviitaleaceae bacterium]
MTIREYTDADEKGWVQCRLLSFLDSSYFDDVKRDKEKYENPSVCYVAEENEMIVGFIDIEFETVAGDVCYFKDGLGAVIWHLGVLPKYRRKGIAMKLWNVAKSILIEKGITHFEVWTQDDNASTAWYENQGFVFKEAYLNAFIQGSTQDDVIKQYINMDNAGEIWGIKNFNFEAPLERKKELEQVCHRLHEVRLYILNCAI